MNSTRRTSCRSTLRTKSSQTRRWHGKKKSIERHWQMQKQPNSKLMQNSLHSPRSLGAPDKKPAATSTPIVSRLVLHLFVASIGFAVVACSNPGPNLSGLLDVSPALPPKLSTAPKWMSSPCPKLTKLPEQDYKQADVES